MTTYKLSNATRERVRAITTAAAANADRPQCATCGKYGPTINGRCSTHLSLPTLCALDTVSAEDVADYYTSQTNEQDNQR